MVTLDPGAKILEGQRKMALLSAGVKESNILSGDINVALEVLKERDCLVLKGLGGLGTSLSAVYKRWLNLTEVKKARVIFLDMPYMNTVRIEEEGNAQADKIASAIFVYIL